MQSDQRADTVVILDFETTGLSPTQGDRAIEIGAVKLEQGSIVDRFQQLMNPGRRIDAFIEEYTGISNAMVQVAPPCHQVMSEFADFIQGCNLVAHNASFDARFLQAELERIGDASARSFACSMLIARRVYPQAPNHQLGTLVRYKSLPNDGTFHRALADAQMTAHLWMSMLEDISQNHHIESISFGLMQQISRTPKAKLARFLRDQVREGVH